MTKRFLRFITLWNGTITITEFRYWASLTNCHDHLNKVPILSFAYTVIVLLILLINTGVLMNTVRIVMMKLASDDRNRVRVLLKTLKGMVLLLPLLGTYQLFYVYKHDAHLSNGFILLNILFDSLQGSAISVIYCYMNKEIRKKIQRKLMLFWEGQSELVFHNLKFSSNDIFLSKFFNFFVKHLHGNRRGSYRPSSRLETTTVVSPIRSSSPSLLETPYNEQRERLSTVSTIMS